MMFQKLSFLIQNKAKQLLRGSIPYEDIERAVNLFINQKQMRGYVTARNVKHQNGALILTIHSPTLKHQLHIKKEELLKYIQKSLPPYSAKITRIRFQ